MKYFIILFFFLFLGCHSQHKKSPHKSKHKHHLHPQDEDMQHDFSDAEMWSKRFDNKERDSWQKPQEIVEVMQINKTDKIADIGAGTGYLLAYLSQATGPKGKVYALDVEKKLVEFMKTRIQKEGLLNTSAEQIPFDSAGKRIKEVDKIVVLNTWHHIENRDKYSNKLIKDLKPGAEIYIVDFEKGTKGPGPKESHRTLYKDTAKELQSAGFKCKQAKESLDYHYIAVCQKPL